MTKLTCCSAHGEALTCLDQPKGLDAIGRKAYQTLVEFLLHHELTYTGGCKAFYSPAEWEKRGELYCRSASLIVVYDGGEVREAMTLDAECYKLNAEMQAVLRESGFFFEEGTGWYGGVYLM